MSQLILVRHAAPRIVPEVPAAEWHLSPAGRAAAATLASQLDAYHPLPQIASSDESKARETAAFIAARFGMPVTLDNGLREHDRSGTPYLGTEAFAATIARFFAAPQERVFGRETADQALRRFTAAVAAHVAMARGGDVVVVTHGTVLALYVGAATGRAAFAVWRELGLPCYFVFALPHLRLVHGG
ncbi:MAG: histidine phosphatase family protein [Ktedonobacterales bacterium]